MTRLKTYSLGAHGMPRPEVVAALGLPSWVRQVQIVVADRNKAAAHALLETRRVFISLADAEFRMNDGSGARALREAGLLGSPTVFAYPLTGNGADALVEVLSGGHPKVVGVLRRAAGVTVLDREIAA